MANIFLGTEVEPSAFEIALQGMFLDGLQKRVGETGDFSEAIRHTLGFKTDPTSGELVTLTEQERFDSLDPIEQDTFNTFKLQLGEIEKAFSGEKTEFQKERSRQEAEITSEALARRGGSFVRSDTERGLSGLTGLSTAAIQTIGKKQLNEGLQVSAEQEDRKRNSISGLLATGQQFNNLQSNRRSNLVSAPNRFDIGGAGLLESAAKNSQIQAANTQANISGFGGLLGDIAKTGIINTYF